MRRQEVQRRARLVISYSPSLPPSFAVRRGAIPLSPRAPAHREILVLACPFGLKRHSRANLIWCWRRWPDVDERNSFSRGSPTKSRFGSVVCASRIAQQANKAPRPLQMRSEQWVGSRKTAWNQKNSQAGQNLRIKSLFHSLLRHPSMDAVNARDQRATRPATL